MLPLKGERGSSIHVRVELSLKGTFQKRTNLSIKDNLKIPLYRAHRTLLLLSRHYYLIAVLNGKAIIEKLVGQNDRIKLMKKLTGKRPVTDYYCEPCLYIPIVH